MSVAIVQTIEAMINISRETNNTGRRPILSEKGPAIIWITAVAARYPATARLTVE